MALDSVGTRSLNSIATGCTCAVLSTLLAFLPTGATAGCSTGGGPAPAPSASASAEPPLDPIGEDIFAVNRDTAFYYSFQSNLDGSAKSKKELRVDRNLWNDCAQLQIRLPYVTVYPPQARSSADVTTFSAFGNAELRYSYRVDSPTFDHAIVLVGSFPTAGDGVESLDTELKALYAAKWRWSGGSIAYASEYDQTVIRPPGATYTSYYEGTLTLPNVTFIDSSALRGVKVSGIYNYRVLFNDGGTFKSAVGAIINGNLNDVAFNVTDTWGTGAHALWKYKFEATLAARF